MADPFARNQGDRQRGCLLPATGNECDVTALVRDINTSCLECSSIDELRAKITSVADSHALDVEYNMSQPALPNPVERLVSMGFYPAGLNVGAPGRELGLGAEASARRRARRASRHGRPGSPARPRADGEAPVEAREGDFDRLAAQAEVGGDLVVRVPGSEQHDDPALAGGDPRHGSADRRRKTRAPVAACRHSGTVGHRGLSRRSRPHPGSSLRPGTGDSRRR